MLKEFCFFPYFKIIKILKQIIIRNNIKTRMAANSTSIVTLLLLLIAIAIFFGLTITFKNTQDSGDSALRSDLAVVTEDISLLNDSLCVKIMDVNSTLSGEISDLYAIFDSVNMSLYFDLSASIVALNESLTTEIQEVNTTLNGEIVDLNSTLCTKIMNGDNLLESEILVLNGTLSAEIEQRILTLNNVTGGPGARNLDLVANGTGFSVQPSPLTNSIYLENTGVVTINSVPSFVGSNDLLLTGIGMININSYPLTSTVEVDGSALSTAISNLQMQNNMQQMEISILEGNVTDLQTEISNLQMMGNMIAEDLNGTTITFNMTLMTLIMDVMTLQSQMIALQMQVAALNSAAVPPGTITPFGGTVIPTGYLLCDGSEYEMANYTALYAVIGTMYCPGPCSSMTTFAVPDLRGKIPAGQGGTALSGAIGSNVGAETHTLTAGQMPSHSHSGSTNTDGNHAHHWYIASGMGAHTCPNIGQPCPCPVGGTNCGGTTYSTFGFKCDYNGGLGYTTQTNMLPVDCANSWTPGDAYTGMNTGYDATNGQFPPSSAAHSHAFTTGSAGSGQAHNNIQPSLIVKYIIKT